MNLSFSTIIKNKPTFFVEKIWTAFNLGIGDYQIDYTQRIWWIEKCAWGKALKYDLLTEVGIKIHTIRADAKNRWRVGMNIHFVIHNRTPNRFQFAPILPVVSIQTIEIGWWDGQPIVVIDQEYFYNPAVDIDKGMRALAENDGFDSVDAFFKYFNTDFSGKIIHWTNFKY